MINVETRDINPEVNVLVGLRALSTQFGMGGGGGGGEKGWWWHSVGR